MDYQDSRIGFLSVASANAALLLPPPAPDAPAIGALIPAPFVAKLVQGLEAELHEALSYAAFLEKALIERNAAAEGLPFYLQ